MKVNDENTSFLDILSATVASLSAITILLLLLINITPKEQKEKVTLEAKAMVTMSWLNKSKNDVDLWVRDPSGRIIYYGAKEAPGMELDRDDRGTTTDTVIVNGKRIVIELNQEIVKFRFLLDGMYVVNIKMYSSSKGPFPEPVTITFYDMQNFTQLYKNTINLVSINQEINILVFYVKNGKIQNIETNLGIMIATS